MNTTGANAAEWYVVPQTTLFNSILLVLFLYLFFRHVFFVLMIFDLLFGWLRQFRWFPGPGKRKKTVVNWLIAVVLFGGYLALAGGLRWIEFVPA